jgi:hypothetical protein
VKIDSMTIEILADGAVKTTTDPISSPNHQNAEELLRFMARLAGGADQFGATNAAKTNVRGF